MKPDSPHCSKCGRPTSWGVVRRWGSELRSGLEFVIPGTPTSMNPIKAFRQGLNDETSDVVLDLAGLTGLRCSSCGYIEFYLRDGLGPV